MTEGPATRTKRMGARFFKNPPQPHMCIRDHLKESWHACYINVLSWDKIGMVACPSDGLPLYGGMKINPPRTENPHSAVFFVMANPEILRRNGKNAQDPKEQSSLIELLLDFVESMNEGVVFRRTYKILDDRDITGELKEIWSIVQSDKAKAQDTFGSEDVMRPVPQYPQYQDQAQNQQKHQQQQQHQQKSHHQQIPQQYRQPPPQQHQHQLQQMQTQHQQPQPPQYHYNYSIPNRGPVEKCDNYDLGYARRHQITNNSQNDRVYQSRPVTNPNDINRRNRIYGYDYQQLPRPMGPPYPTANCHPNANLGCPNMTNPGVRPVFHIAHALENNVFVKLHRMEQPQQPQLQLAHAPPVQRYESMEAFYKRQALNAQMGLMGIFGPQTHASSNNSSNKRQANSPTHANCSNSSNVNENPGKSKSPVKVLQRDSSIISPDGTQMSEDTVRHITVEKKIVQVTDLDEEEPKGQIVNGSDETLKIKSSDVSRKLPTESPCELMMGNTECDTNLPPQSTGVCNIFSRDQSNKKQGKTKIIVLKRDHSSNNGSESDSEDGKVMKNGVTCNIGSQQNNGVNEKMPETEQLQSEKSNNSISGTGTDIYIDNTRVVFHEDTSYIGLKERRMWGTSEISTSDLNGRIHSKSKKNDKETDSVQQVYTILRKPESTSSQEELTHEIAQLSMKECTDSSDIGAVPS